MIHKNQLGNIHHIRLHWAVDFIDHAKWRIDPENKLIIAFDQGSEFADYKHLRQEKPYKIYYCETHSPWQKGSNENMNGRLRLYLPRETEIDKITLEEFNELTTTMS